MQSRCVSVASLSYNKLLEPVGDVISCMESLLGGAFGSTSGDQRECFKRIHAYSWGVHTLVMDVITSLGIENAATRPAVLDRYYSLIRPINNNLDNLVSGFDGELAEEQLQIIAFVENAVSVIDQMIVNVWHYSLLQHDKLPFAIVAFDSLVLFREVNTILVDSALPNVGQSFRILGDETWLRYAFGEVARNIWQHGSVENVRFDVQPGADLLDITLYDAGQGFAAAETDAPFRPFWQAHEHKQGLGLGLFLAKAFIDISGGTISISSEPSKGTLVKISLALAS